MIIALVSIIVISAVYWWIQPRTPEELFRVRCASCHELQTQRLCEFSAELRPAIVQVMRQTHGANEVINQNEAVLIEQYLREDFQCR